MTPRPCDHAEYRRTIEGYVCARCKAPMPTPRRAPSYARDWNDAVARIPAHSEDGLADVNVCHGPTDRIIIDWPLDCPPELTSEGARLLAHVLLGLAAGNEDARERRIRRNTEARRVD